MARIAAHRLAERHSLVALLEIIVPVLEGQQRLSEHHLALGGESEEDITADEVRLLLFQRLSPLLLLRVLPTSAFRPPNKGECTGKLDEGDPLFLLNRLQGRLTEALMERVTLVFEFDEVRKLAAEILAG